MELLRFLGRRPGVKQVLLGSGIRYDLWLDTPELLEELMREHGGSFLRVAPEHGSDRVLRWMNKPSFDHFPRFVSLFERINSRLRRPLRLAPYMVVGHPGEEARDVEETVSAFRRLRLSLRDVQMFTPSPGSRATALYVAGCDETGAELPVCRDIREVERRKNRLIEGTRR